MDLKKQLWILEYLINGYTIAKDKNSTSLINFKLENQYRITSLDFEILYYTSSISPVEISQDVIFYDITDVGKAYLSNP